MPHAKPSLEAPDTQIPVRTLLRTRPETDLMRATLLLFGLLLTVAPLNGNEPLKISVSPSQSMAPANLHIRLSIEPNAINRLVSIVAESEDYFRSSEVAIEGEGGPRTVIVEFRSVPGGHYEIRSALGDAKGRQVATARQDVFVVSSGLDR
jgi:uncharacterized protein (DUF58 family)